MVGAGLTGLWTAYYLLKADPRLRVVALEAETAGFGASGRNGGWCSALFPAGLAKLAGLPGSDRDRALAQHRAMRATVDEVLRVATSEGIDAQARKGGTVAVARSAAQLRSARAEVADARRWGRGEDDLRLLDATEARRRLDAVGTVGGTFTPDCAATPAAGVGDLGAGGPELGRGPGHHHGAALAGLGVDALARRDPEHLVDGGAHRPVLGQCPVPVGAGQAGQLAESGREEGGAPAAVAARGAEARGLGLQHHDAQPRVGLEEVVGGPEAGQPGADHRDVDVRVTGQGCAGRPVLAGRRVPQREAGVRPGVWLRAQRTPQE